MRLEIGKFAGFCDGVKYAVESAFSFAVKNNNDNIYVDGELIHNPQTLKLLKENNVHTLESDDDLSLIDGKDIIIRAHGVTPERKRLLQAHAKNVYNLTCKYVGRLQSIVKKYSALGYRIVIIGNAKHPEVVGVVGFANDDCYVLSSKEDILKLPSEEKNTLIVAQTTEQQEIFDSLVSIIKEKYSKVDLVIKNTICKATEQRQNEVVEIAKRNDVVLIIGGANSSNTRNLYKIASSIKPAFYVEYKEDLDKIDLSTFNSVGIMAGASTPDWLIMDIANTVKEKYSSRFKKVLNYLLDFTMASHLFFSVGAFLLSFAVSKILSEEFAHSIGVITALYYNAMSILNGYTNDALFLSDKKKYEIYSKYKIFFVSMITTSIFIILIISYRMGRDIFMLIIFSTVLGIIYNLSFKKIKSLEHSIFIKVLSSLIPFKAFIISFAVTFLLNGSIFLQHRNSVINNKLTFLFSAAFVFLLMFIRQVFFEIRSSQSDKIAGATTLTSYIDSSKLAVLVSLLPILLIMIMSILMIFHYYPSELKNIINMIPIAYSGIISLLLTNKKILSSNYLFFILIDTPLYVAGIVSFI